VLTASHLHHTRACVFGAIRYQAGGCKPAPHLAVGRQQRRRIMCNYNRQSKTKPFNYNELLLEKGRLPQGGIVMKQMAECTQGQTQTVLLFTVCQHFKHSEELHLSLDCSLCASQAGKKKKGETSQICHFLQHKREKALTREHCEYITLCCI